MKEIIDRIHSSESTIADETIDNALEWITKQSFNDLKETMKTDNWWFEWEREYDQYDDTQLHNLASDMMYEDPSYVVESIARCMNIEIKEGK